MESSVLLDVGKKLSCLGGVLPSQKYWYVRNRARQAHLFDRAEEAKQQ